ncbi:hypothetical protein JT359_02230 [Candidatus Poribacteria bacterium]|nr:hypothetical protein [Candidatus Poribacteria bacterium]
MFKLKFQTIAIAAVIVSLLLIGVNNSKAGNITSLSTSANTDYGSDASVSASLSADADINYIDWYIKQTYPADEADTDYTHVHTSMHSHGTRSVSVGLGPYAGHIKIAEYDVKAVVNFRITLTPARRVYQSINPFTNQVPKPTVSMDPQNSPLSTMIVHLLSWMDMSMPTTISVKMQQGPTGFVIQPPTNRWMS